MVIRLPKFTKILSETAGIKIEGDNKWKTIIQVAAKQKSDD